MSSEARKGILRVLSNYGRLITTLVMGLFVVRILLRAVGDDAFGLIAFMGSTVGLTAMLRDIVNRSLVRELGEAIRTDRFPTVLNSALGLMLVLGLISLGLFGILIWALRFFDKIPPDMMFACRVFVLTKGLETFFTLFLSPYFNSYLITERMVAYNLWRIADRSSVFLAAIALLVMDIHDPADGIMLYGVLTTALVLLVQLASAVGMVSLDRRYLPRPSLASLKEMIAICRVGGWNAAQVAATSAHARIDGLLMFLWMGPLGGRLFGIAFQLTSYIRQTAVGMTQGLDAVATRMSVTAEQEQINRLTDYSTRFNAAVVLPTMAAMAVMATALIEVWVRDRLGDPATEIPMIATLIRVFAIGILARSIGDGWIAIFYGAGHIRRFAPAIVYSAIANPVIAVALWFTLPKPIAYLAPAIAYALTLLASNMVAVPLLAAQPFHIKPRQLFIPMTRPAIVTLLALPILVIAELEITTWNLRTLAVVGAGYGLAVLVLSWWIVLKTNERRRLLQGITRRLQRRRAHSASS